MAERFTVFTSLSSSFRSSSEFILCLKLFKKALPRESAFHFADESRSAALRELIEANRGSMAPHVLVVREPSLLMGKNMVEMMAKILDNYPSSDCVLPSDIRGCRPGRLAAYLTLRGFEKFVETLYNEEEPLMGYDGRYPWMFLIRGSVLKQMAIPPDPMEIPRLLVSHRVSISLNAYVHSFHDYYQKEREEAVDLVPETVRSLLDIGCASGRFGGAVKKKIGCLVIGVEVNEREANFARDVLDAVFVGDFLSLEIEEKFDCITCLDVIEHLTDPEAFLRKARSLLVEGGRLVLSVPNVGHWSIVEDLLAGRWDYVPAGTLCISHLRFFTKATFLSLADDAGLEVLSVREQAFPIPENIRRCCDFLEHSGFEVDEKSLSSLGYYITLKK